MQKTYYIFRDNKILNRREQQTMRPLDQQEWHNISTTICPQTIIESPTVKGSYTVELTSETCLPHQYEWISLRSLVGQVTDQLFQQWGRASQLLYWSKTNKYCGSCGQKTVQHPSELAKICLSCDLNFYPAISPCIIVLVCRNKELLLARSPRFPEKMFSTLAGFIEPGESAEETVEREIYEEVCLKVKNIRYFDSQPWPFPGQLMLGFFADYKSGEIKIDGEEICEAHWYTHDQLPQIPGTGTIAGLMIRHYISTFQQHYNYKSMTK